MGHPVHRRRLHAIGSSAWSDIELTWAGVPTPDDSALVRQPDSNLAVFDVDVVGAELDREVELVLPRAHVVLPAVPRAAEDAALEAALAERALEVEAVLLDGVEAAVAMR